VRFFDSNGDRHSGEPIPYNAPRAILGSVQRLNLKKGAQRSEKRAPLEWQIAAWRFYDQIGEIHYAFSLIGQIISRVRLFVAVVVSDDDAPVDVDVWLESMEDAGNPDTVNRVADKAKELLNELTEHTAGRESGMLRTFALNFCVPGEAYLAQQDKEWLVLSPEELIAAGSGYRVRRSRVSQTRGDVALDSNAFVARLFRPSPRYGLEPDSSMVAVLDICEELVLLDQVMRAMARRAMNAGLVFIPEGITAFAATAEDETLADSIANMAVDSVETEGAVSTVTPKVVTGPPELGDAIKPIKLADPVDQNISQAADRLIERIMAGLDIPKEVVKGVANVRYSNAIVIEDSMYRAHIEPLVLLIVDCLTSAYLQPLLLKQCETDGEREVARRFVVWADTSAIVTRPDKSQAADTGWTNHLLSGEAWRRTRGFVETDAPNDEELLTRLAIEKAIIPPEMATVLIERLAPEFFAAQREAGAAEAGIPSDIGQLLSGEMPAGPAEPPPPEGLMNEQLTGGEINQGGTPAPVPPPAGAPIPV
jgi:hypothetical protein